MKDERNPKDWRTLPTNREVKVGPKKRVGTKITILKVTFINLEVDVGRSKLHSIKVIVRLVLERRDWVTNKSSHNRIKICTPLQDHWKTN